MSVKGKGSMNIYIPQGCLSFGGVDNTDYIDLDKDIVINSDSEFTICSWLYWDFEKSDIGILGNDTSYTDGRLHFANNDHISMWLTNENEVNLTTPQLVNGFIYVVQGIQILILEYILMDFKMVILIPMLLGVYIYQDLVIVQPIQVIKRLMVKCMIFKYGVVLV